MDKERLYNIIDHPATSHRIVIAAVIAAMVSAVTLLVYLTGGIKYVYSHAMYVPIILGGMAFGLRGGLLAGMIGGLALGPFMPIDTTTGEMQLLINWLYRSFFFMLVGALTGAGFQIFREHILFLKWLQLHDPNTRLPNYWALIKHLRENRDNNPVTSKVLAFIEFKSMNDISATVGLKSSDEIIVDINNRLLDSLPTQTRVYQPQPQMLAALIPAHLPQTAAEIITKLSGTLTEEPVNYRGIPIYTDPYIGYIQLETIVDDPAHVVRKAEIAAHHARTQAQPWLHFSSEFDSFTQENLELLGQLDNAIKTGQLAIHHQPKLDLRTRKVDSVEALTRWEHPQKGTIPPSAFIPKAEDSNLINSLTDYVIDNGLRQLHEWCNTGMDLVLAVNVSTRNLQQHRFSEKILDMLLAHDINGNKLEIEITESSLMVDVDNAARKLQKLADEGIAITIDDFGTGYSSLKYLSRLPISSLKIDQSFVFHMSQDAQAREIVASIINLAHNLGMWVVAEGIENEETLRLLQAMDCDVGQGYYFSKALEASAFSAWYAANQPQQESS